MKQKPIAIVSCKGASNYAEKVHGRLEELCREQGQPDPVLVESREVKFPDGETKTQVDQSLRNRDVYIFQDPYNTTVTTKVLAPFNPNKPESKSETEIPYSVNDHIAALSSAQDSVHQADSENTQNIVVPAYPYARQDKPGLVYRLDKTNPKGLPREGITAKTIAKILDRYNGGRVYTFDIHNDAITGFFDHKVLENLYASTVLIPKIRENINLEDAIVISPDTGRNDMAGFYARALGLPRAMMDKLRDDEGNVIDHYLLTREGQTIDRRTAIIVDDMWATSKTLMGGLEDVNGRFDEIFVVAPLPILSKEAKWIFHEAHKNGIITKAYTTDAIYHGEAFASGKIDWYEAVPTTNYMANTIFNNNQGNSTSKLAMTAFGQSN